ncbi:haloacid dehalogenase superfamily, subfamily IA, variant 3 with third motif having DD or ED/beta-phosphoglucomutase family hydrolase [Parapedobacter composti]|uniref:Haloacid dehalogenase superfamily, subfamily IA, variant 3 with third motif having DD or ED/beta-phosphoglucomutase family hydrolase n=1 Tax=Parapedobacter composti TaxID=623281 RepID=A0A1I1G9X8_9SPHI|nr:HAD family phosphatase [Parapedobacter composti]SFC08334.1 haloacid dehalogenase superfamily, subfamily IA, variant 3 with third motif having DD or ED/beta-phosphoglucomutase family hydrolase [Parapedobacter composti]
MDNYAVIFDMDGVIAHTNPYHTEAFKQFFDKYRVPYTEQEFEEHMYGKHNSYIMSHFFKRPVRGDELKRLEDEKEGLFREIYKAQIKPIDGFLEFLASLKAAGFRTGVATSAPRANLDLIMDGLGFRTQMASVLSSEDVQAHKPDPEIYLKSAQNLGVDPTHCVVFEDSHSGVTAAIRAGTKVVGVLTSHTREQLPPCHDYVYDYRGVDATRVKQLFASGNG